MNRLHSILPAIFLMMFSVTGHAALQVVTTTQDLAALVATVGGEYVQVQSLTSGTSDPHFAVAKPSMIRKVFRADLLLIIGADMEIGWLPPLLQAARNTRVQPGNPGHLDLSSAVPILGKLRGPVSRALGDVHAKGNPHYWLDPRNGVHMARAIAARLGELDPEHAAEYERRFRAFEQTLNDKFLVWLDELSHLRDKPVVAYHTSFIYLADAFGFRIVDEVEPKPGIAPSAASLSALLARITADQIGFLIMEPYYERRSARYLNEYTGIHIAVLPQSVGARKGIDSYFDLFDAIVTELKNVKDD